MQVAVESEVFAHETTQAAYRSQPELVHLRESLPTGSTQNELVRYKKANWPLRFAVAAALGVVGGLVAAVVLQPAPPAVHPYLPSTIRFDQWRSTVESAVANSSTATTNVTVDVPSLQNVRKREQNADLQRLKVRNRRLEALVKVLRERTAETDRQSAGSDQ